MKIFDIQRNLLVETFPQLEALSLALIDENGMKNYMKMKNSFKSNASSAYKQQKTLYQNF